MSEAFLSQDVREELTRALAGVTQPVEAVVFGASSLVIPGTDQPGLHAETLALLREVAEASGKLTVTSKPLSDPQAQALGITRSPTTLLREAGGARTNIRFSGLPSGYEFGTLVETIRMLGTGESDLGERTREELNALKEPVTLQAFVTPTCPYCPRAVLAGFKLAFHNPLVTAEGIEANEFPAISAQYNISGVPDTIITGQQQRRVLGGQPDHVFLKEALLAAGAA